MEQLGEAEEAYVTKTPMTSALVKTTKVQLVAPNVAWLSQIGRDATSAPLHTLRQVVDALAS